HRDASLGVARLVLRRVRVDVRVEDMRIVRKLDPVLPGEISGRFGAHRADQVTVQLHLGQAVQQLLVAHRAPRFWPSRSGVTIRPDGTGSATGQASQDGSLARGTMRSGETPSCRMLRIERAGET